MRKTSARWRRSVAIGVLCSGAFLTTAACGDDGETSGVVSDVQDKAEEAATDVKDAADEAADDAKSTAEDAAEQTKETAGDVKDEADAAKDKADEEMTEMGHDAEGHSPG